MIKTGRNLRDEGIKIVEQNSNTIWRELAYNTLKKIAQSQETVHIDDILACQVSSPHHPNAWGAVWLKAIRNKIIKRTTKTQLCEHDRHKHAHRYPVYASLIY